MKENAYIILTLSKNIFIITAKGMKFSLGYAETAF